MKIMICVLSTKQNVGTWLGSDFYNFWEPIYYHLRAAKYKKFFWKRYVYVKETKRKLWGARKTCRDFYLSVCFVWSLVLTRSYVLPWVTKILMRAAVLLPLFNICVKRFWFNNYVERFWSRKVFSATSYRLASHSLAHSKRYNEAL